MAKNVTCGCNSSCSHCGGKHTMAEVGKECSCCGNKIKKVETTNDTNEQKIF